MYYLAPLHLNSYRVYCYFKFIFNSFSAGIDFWSQIVTSDVNPRTEGLKNIKSAWLLVIWFLGSVSVSEDHPIRRKFPKSGHKSTHWHSSYCYDKLLPLKSYPWWSFLEIPCLLQISVFPLFPGQYWMDKHTQRKWHPERRYILYGYISHWKPRA